MTLEVLLVDSRTSWRVQVFWMTYTYMAQNTFSFQGSQQVWEILFFAQFPQIYLLHNCLEAKIIVMMPLLKEELIYEFELVENFAFICHGDHP